MTDGTTPARPVASSLRLSMPDVGSLANRRTGNVLPARTAVPVAGVRISTRGPPTEINVVSTPMLPTLSVAVTITATASDTLSFATGLMYRTMVVSRGAIVCGACGNVTVLVLNLVTT